MGFPLFAFENGQQRFAHRWFGFLAVNFTWVFRPGDVLEGRGDIDDVPNLVGHACFDYAGPMGDKRAADTPFVIRRFEFSIGGITGIGPSYGNRTIAFDGSGWNVGRGVGLLRTSAVVSEKKNEGVLPLA